MAGKPTTRTELENIRAAHIEAAELVRIVLLQSAVSTPTERRNVRRLCAALEAMNRAKRHICALHPQSTQGNDIPE